MNKGDKRGIELVVSGSDSAEPFDFPEETLYQVSFFIEPPINRPGIGGVAFGWDGVSGPRFCNILPDFLCSISPVAQHAAALDLDFPKHFYGMSGIVITAWRQRKYHRIA